MATGLGHDWDYRAAWSSAGNIIIYLDNRFVWHPSEEAMKAANERYRLEDILCPIAK